MKTYARSSKGLCATAVVRLPAAFLAILVMICLASSPAFAGCTLNGNPVACALTGPLTINSYDDGTGALTTSTGALTDNGTMTIKGGIELVGDTSLLGPGVLTLINGQMGTNGNGFTLTNASTIDGSGIIGSNGLTFQNLSLSNSGTIDADSTGSTLSIQGTGSSIVNSGTFEATNGGILNLATSAAIDNNGGTIAATGTGSTVNISTTIQGGTLSTSGGGLLQTSGGATLDASSQGAITLTDGSTYTAGSGLLTKVTGTLNLGTVSGSTLALAGGLELIGDTTVVTPGSGSITMANGQIGTNGNAFTLTNSGLIQGSGVIGSNGLTFQNLNFANAGTIDANINAATLSIQGTGSSIVNSATFEATNGGILNLATTAAINNNGGTIKASGTGSTVNISTTIEGGTLSTSSGGLLQTSGGATLDASSQGPITVSNGSTYTAGPAGSSIITRVTGTLNLGTTTGSTMALGGALELIGDTAVNTPGSGSITMTSGQIGTNGNGFTLTNNGLIQGSGLIGSNATTFQNLSLTNKGTINANSSGNTLSVQGTGSAITNAGLFEATNGATLNVATSAAVDNSAGTIKSSGTNSVVNLSNTIKGGTLTTQSGGVLQTSGAVTLDASTLGAITLTDGSTYLAGNGTATALTNVTGQLNLGATTGSTLQVNTALSNFGYLRLVGDTTLAGPGSVVMSGGLIGTNGNSFTLTNNNTIQGDGVIGSNFGSDFQNLSLHNNGTINANSNGNTLSIQGTGSSIINASLFEATNGGTLDISTSSAVNNQNGSIVAANGSAVNLINTTIQGGTLTTQGTGLMQTNGTVNLDASTLGAITFTDGSTYVAGDGTATVLTQITGQLNLGTVTGSTLQVTSVGSNFGFLRLIGNTTVSGHGLIVLNGGLVGTNGNSFTLTNNDTIEGLGVIGSNFGSDFQNLSLDNTATIDANSNGNTLSIQGTGSSIVNTGLFEATNGGILNLATSNPINNAGGNITATGAGSTVDVSSTTIQGGTLNTSGGGVMQTVGVAKLDGVTHGAITISDGSTYAIGAASTLTDTLGTLNLGTSTGGTLTLSTDMRLVGDTTLSGPGSLTMSGNAQIGTNGNAFTLTNDSTIQGTGLIGSNIGSLNGNNELTNNGVIVTNGGGITLGGSGTLTNTGTLHATAGTTLISTMSGLSASTFAGTTLLTGTYWADASATIQINKLGTTGGEIVNNAATIVLNGVGSAFLDGGGKDTLSNFNNNMATGSFTILNGRNFTSPISTDFANAGAVIVGSGSTFTAGGVHSYVQSGGSTQLNGTLVPGPLFPGGGEAAINGGVLFGNGGTVIGGDLRIAGGTIAPAATINGSNVPTSAGSLSVNGIYIQNANGVFNLGLGGLAPGSQFGFLGVSGNAFIDGTLNVNLLNSFFPAVGNTFTFLTTGGSVTGIFATVNGLNIGNNEQLSVMYGANYVEITTLAVTTTDNWLGGTGNWSNGAKWSIGVPASIDDVNIYSGGNDLVTLNLGSTAINSLALGGPTNSFTSELTDGGTAQNLTITNGLTVGQQGVLAFTGNGSSINAATVSNNGAITIGPGATLNLTGQPSGVTSVAAGASWTIGGNFAVGGVANTGFANLSNNAGAVIFENGASQTISPFLTNTGSLDVSNASALTTLSGVDNSGSLTAGFNGSGSNAFIINGVLTNNAGGFVDVEHGSTLTVTGNVTNNAGGPQGIYTSFNGTGGNTINILGTLTNNGMFGLEGAGDNATIGGAVTNSGSFQLTGGSMATFTSALTNSGTLDLENASTLNINSTVNNSGTFSTSANGGTGGNNVTVTGLFTNQAGGQLSVNGPTDVLKAAGGIVNNGTVTVKNSSTIDPPFVNNLGTINIDGTSTFVVGTGTATGPGFVQLANGTFGEMINSATAFGQVDVAGSASLNGTLDILLQSGYNPAVGTSFTFLLLNPGQLTGTYATILNDIFNGGTEKWVVNYNDAGGFVSLTAAQNNSTVPEPGTFLLLGSGLLGMAYGVRRRWLK